MTSQLLVPLIVLYSEKRRGKLNHSWLSIPICLAFTTFLDVINLQVRPDMCFTLRQTIRIIFHQKLCYYATQIIHHMAHNFFLLIARGILWHIVRKATFASAAGFDVIMTVHMNP